MKIKKYRLDEILKRNADYNVIFGERSSGKSYAALEYGAQHYFETGRRTVIIRRWKEDFIGPLSARTCYDSLCNDSLHRNRISDLSGERYQGVEYYSGKYFLTQLDENGVMKKTDQVIAYGVAITQGDHLKMGSFPDVDIVIFDEFMTRNGYLPDEFIYFQNVLSTIIRDRDDVKIFMLGNNVDKFNCPYFTEMGLTHIHEQKQNTIDVYEYGDSGLRVAVEWTENLSATKKSNKYFAFNNPRLQMITDGKWELGIYPHKPRDYNEFDVVFSYFIIFNNRTVQCDIISDDISTFTFIHNKTTPIRDKNPIIYTLTPTDDPLTYVRIDKPCNRITERIYKFYVERRVFYQDNEVGEFVTSYIYQASRV